MCLYGEAMHLQCFTPTLYVMGVAAGTYKRDDHYPIYTKLHYGYLACIMWSYYACSYTMWTFPDNFFFCLVCQPRLLEKNKNKKINIYANSPFHHNCYEAGLDRWWGWRGRCVACQWHSERDSNQEQSLFSKLFSSICSPMHANLKNLQPSLESCSRYYIHLAAPCVLALGQKVHESSMSTLTRTVT